MLALYTEEFYTEGFRSLKAPKNGAAEIA